MPPAEAITGFRIVIRFPDGRSEQLLIDSDRVLIGSGAHCEIRLPAEVAAVEHVQLSFVGGGIHAQARTMQPLPTIDGTGFTQTPVLPEAVLGVGPVQIWASQTVIADNPNVIRKKTQPTSPLTYVLAVLAIPLAAYVLLYDEPQDRPAEAPAEVAALWGAPVTTCPQSAPDQALGLGQEKKVMAEAKRERRPFHVQDGVAAVPLFETASACFRAAGQVGPANDLASAAATLRTKVGEDYRAHQVRLEHALSVNDLVTAQKEVQVLRAFTEGKVGPYVVWLSNLDRKLQLKLGQKARPS